MRVYWRSQCSGLIENGGCHSMGLRLDSVAWFSYLVHKNLSVGSEVLGTTHMNVQTAWEHNAVAYEIRKVC